ncbi:MAG: hypothetical protein M1817_006901 [Caeruleum heppii]|nr:MAG: hypothetical protein M1817_006901 [Caeruleum heppii]
MSKEQMSEYLSSLRTNRVARPSGSRPLPGRKSIVTPDPEYIMPLVNATSSSLNLSTPSNTLQAGQMLPERSVSAMSHRRDASGASGSRSPTKGRSIVQPPRATSAPRRSWMVTPSGTYVENEERIVERQEARRVREALEHMDLRDEIKLHASAQDEATELVSKHRNPGAPYRTSEGSVNSSHVPDESRHEIGLERQYEGGGRLYTSGNDQDYPKSEEQAPHPAISTNIPIDSRLTKGGAKYDDQTPTMNPSFTGATEQSSNIKTHELWDSPQKKAYLNLGSQVAPLQSGHRRRTSGAKSRQISAGSLFRNPNDHIYEEPQEDLVSSMKLPAVEAAGPAPLRPKLRNPLNSIQSAHSSPARANSEPMLSQSKVSSIEIHKNPPSQTRNAGYRTNAALPTPPDSSSESDINGAERRDAAQEGLEIRSDDIRQATSMRRRDRSPRLPSPAFVSDAPDRPIVSFDAGWQSRDKQQDKHDDLGKVRRGGSDASLVSIRTPPIPTIVTPDSPQALPIINVMDVPTISVDSSPGQSPSDSSAPKVTSPSKRPLPAPGSRAARPLPHHSASAPPVASTPHYSVSTRRPTASCTQCQLPIAGRIVSAAGERFHPECFVCYNCGEGLECVAFYPEPDVKRAERVERIRRRARGEDIEEIEGQGPIEDGTESPRFYCHLDFHEFFSPRCRSCKTPIEGEVIVACGGEWHAGHFFCAECGDPFDSSTPFVEKDGYAWCVNCHTNRYSTRCKKCRKPVTDMVVKALGAEWHEQCFCCMECGDGFDDGRYFVRGESEDPVCVKCEEKRLKA